VVQHKINKEMCTVSIVFPLFCPTAICVDGCTYASVAESNLQLWGSQGSENEGVLSLTTNLGHKNLFDLISYNN
jgi:hypothetical protein